MAGDIFTVTAGDEVLMLTFDCLTWTLLRWVNSLILTQIDYKLNFGRLATRPHGHVEMSPF